MNKLIFAMALVLMVICLTVATSGTALAQTALETIYVSEGSLDDHECDNVQWHFVINQLIDASQAPESIEVTWSNGVTEATQTVELSNVTGVVAHYYTTSYLNYEVVGAEAEIDEDWIGEFVLSHGPCNPTSVVLVDFEATSEQPPVLWGIILFILMLVALFFSLVLIISRKKD